MAFLGILSVILALGFWNVWAQCDKGEWSPTPASTHTLNIGLANKNIESVIREAWNVNNPLSPDYGRFWSWEEVLRKTSNTEGLETTLKFFLSRNFSVERISGDKQWITLKAPLPLIEETFNTKCYHYTCKKSLVSSETLSFHRCDEHQLPSEVKQYLDIVLGVSDWPMLEHAPRFFHSVERKESSPPSQWPAGPFLDMTAIKKFYNVNSDSVKLSKTTAAVFEVNAPYEYFNPPDLASFQKLSGLSDQPVTQFAGTSNVTLGCPNYACAEPNLDVAMVLGIAPGVDFTYYTTDVLSGNPVLTYLTDLSSKKEVPWIHSLSWGPQESHLSPSTAKRIDEEFAKLSLRGLTFVTSSGDDGVNDRKARGNPSLCRLAPQYPAGSPWVTTVGGTFGQEYGIPERACQTNVTGYRATITTGGGFSIWYPQPDYQKSFVAQYLKTAPGLPSSSSFNATNRAYPDISFIANNIDNIINQNFLPLGGTSASAPIFAGMLALILDAKFQESQSPLGAVNPALYHLAQISPDVFNDITVGDNHCTALKHGSYTCCPEGFQATKSWDPVTGLGSANWQKLKDGLLKLGRKTKPTFH